MTSETVERSRLCLLSIGGIYLCISRSYIYILAIRSLNLTDIEHVSAHSSVSLHM
jgi:hypothetical protein